MVLNIGFDVPVETTDVWQLQLKWIAVEERRIGVLEGDRRDKNLPALALIVPTYFPRFSIRQLRFRHRQLRSWTDEQFAKILLSQPGVQAEPNH